MARSVVFGILAVFAGCAAAPVREGAVTVAPGEFVVEMSAGSYFFAPAQVAIPAGRPAVLRIVNRATLIPHSFVLEDPKGNVLVRQPLRKGGETLVRLAPMAQGTYPFYCGESFLGSTHRGKGMSGTLTVEPGGK